MIQHFGKVPNKREKEIAEKYEKLGFNYLHKGWPDFCFYNDEKIFFLEVKRKKKKTSKMGLSIAQRKMIEIFKRLNLEIFVEYI